MKTTEYATLAAAQKAQAFDALMAKTGEHIARTGQKPSVLGLNQADLQSADRYVTACMASELRTVAIGTIPVQLDAAKFSTSMAQLGAYMATNGIANITFADPEKALSGGFPAGSVIGAAIEAAMNSR